MWLGPIWKVAPMRSMNSNLMTHKKLVFDSQCKPAQSYGGLKWIQMYWGGRVLLKCSTSLQFRSVIHHWWPFKKVVCFSLTYLILNAWNNVDFHLNLFMPLSMSDPYIDECMVWIININNGIKTGHGFQGEGITIGTWLVCQGDGIFAYPTNYLGQNHSKPYWHRQFCLGMKVCAWYIDPNGIQYKNTSGGSIFSSKWKSPRLYRNLLKSPSCKFNLHSCNPPDAHNCITSQHRINPFCQNSRWRCQIMWARLSRSQT